MQPTLTVELGPRSYPIYIGTSILSRLPEVLPGEPHQALLITDDTVDALYGDQVRESLTGAGWQVYTAVVPAGEGSKSLEQAARLYDCAVAAGLDRGSPVLGLGGGVVGDLAGFIAATYQRGQPFIQVPTTLLAQVDSSVGGKVGINHPGGKNLIGSFYQPALVLADVAVLGTLPPRQVRAGLAEVVKHGVIADAAYFDLVEGERHAIAALDSAVLAQIVSGSCRIKAGVVSQDERESGKRAILNFGHTVGHAVETAAGYGRWLHGEAVAMGMAAAGRLAVALGLFSGDQLDRMVTLLENLGLPTRLPAIPADLLAEVMTRDKKRSRGMLRWVLPTAIGSVRIVDGIPWQTVGGVLAALGACGPLTQR